MKKYLLMFVLLFTITSTVSAQNVLWYKTSAVAIRYINEYGNWTDWSDWESCVVDVKLDMSNDKIVIYSKETQIYRVINQTDTPYDDSGSQVAFKVIDQDYDIGRVRLRVEDSGNCQIYIDFNDISWVYNVRRVR